jgi:hypothetical protein
MLNVFYEAPQVIPEILTQQCPRTPRTSTHPNQKYNQLKQVFDRFSSRATQEGSDTFNKALHVFELITKKLETNGFDSIYNELNKQQQQHQTHPKVHALNQAFRSIRRNEVLLNKAPFKLVKCVNPIGRPAGTRASAVSFHPITKSRMEGIKRKATNKINMVKSFLTKKPKVTTTIKKTRVRTVTTTTTSVEQQANEDDTSNDADDIAAIQLVTTKKTPIQNRLRSFQFKK